MAQEPYAPNVPDAGTPNYMGWFKPSQESAQLAKEGNKSTGTALAGIAHAFGAGVEAADQALKTHVRETTKDAVEPERSAFIDFLQSEWDQMNTPQPQKASEQPGLSAGPPPPDGFNQGVTNLNRLTAARAMGKIPEMYYLANVDRKVSEIKERWPGYADIAESEADRLTSHGVANQRMRLLMANIQAMNQASDKDHERLLTHVANNVGEEGGADVMNLLQTGKMSDRDGWKWVHQVTSNKAVLSNLENEIKIRNLNDSERSIKAKEWADHSMTADVQQFFFTTRVGFGGDPVKIQDYLDKVSRGEYNDTDENKTKIAAMVQTAAAKLNDQLTAYTYKPITPDGRTLRDLRGREEANNMVKDQMDRIYTVLNPLIDPKTHPIAALNASLSEAMLSDTQNKLLTDPTMSPFFRVTGAMAKFGPGATPLIADVANHWFQNITSKLNQTSTINKLGSAFDTPDPRRPEEYTVKKGVEQLQSSGEPPAKEAKDLVNFVRQVQDTKNNIKTRENIVDHYYSDYNLGLLDHFIPDYTDENGIKHEGKVEVYKLMGGKKQSTAIANMSDEAWTKYVNWHQREFAHLFKGEVDVLSELQQMEGVQVSFNDESSKGYQFKIHIKPPESQIPMTAQEKYQAGGAKFGFTLNRDRNDPMKPYNDSIARLNDALPTLASVAKAGGWDVKEYLMEVMLELGYNPKDTPVMRALMATDEKKLQADIKELTSDQEQTAEGK